MDIKRNIKYVVVDLDGTLLNDKHEVSQRNKEAIKKAVAQGVKVIIDEYTEKESDVEKFTFDDGIAILHRHTDRKLAYRLVNKTDKKFRVFLDVPKKRSFEFISDDLKYTQTKNHYRLDVELDAGANMVVSPVLRRETENRVAVANVNDGTLNSWTELNFMDDVVLDKLKGIFAKRKALNVLVREEKTLSQSILAGQEKERENTITIEKLSSNNQASELVGKLINELDEHHFGLDEKLAELTSLREKVAIANAALDGEVKRLQYTWTKDDESK